MPQAFDSCVSRGGRVRRISGPNKRHGLDKNEYINYCYIDDESYRGETRRKKSIEENKMKKAQFKFKTGTLKSVKGNDGATYLIGIASSTSADRDNDRMSESVLHTMKATAEANLTIFTNHEYKVPDDLFGSCVEATVRAQKDKDPIVVKTVDDEKEIITFDPQELEIKIKVVSEEVNPKARQIVKAIEEDVNLGLSIGGVVEKVKKVYDEITKKTYNLIESINLYEVSLVGIAANEDSMGFAISKALKGIEIKNVDPKEIEKEIDEVIHEPTLKEVHEELLDTLQKDYDELVAYDSYVITPEEKAKADKQRREYAKVSAENALLSAGRKVKTNKDDDDALHLREHAWKMESMVIAEMDTTEIEIHIEKHLKKIK